MKVYKAICDVMGELSAGGGISKDQTNTFDKYKFRGIDDVFNALAPLLAKHGLVVLPRVLERVSEERTSQKGGTLFYITVKVEFDFVSAEDGSKHIVCAYGEAMDRGDKGTNKAMTAAYKYACFEAFCIPTKGTDDADSNSHKFKPREVSTSAGKADDGMLEAAASLGWSKEKIEKVAATANEYWEQQDVIGALEFLASQDMPQEAKIVANKDFNSKFRAAMKKQLQENRENGL